MKIIEYRITYILMCLLVHSRANCTCYCTQLHTLLHAADLIVSHTVALYITHCYLLHSVSIVVTTFKAVIISSFCKLLAIPVYIWAGDWGGLLPELLQVVTRFQVFKGNRNVLAANPACLSLCSVLS